ncbi:MAG: LON peptidase substrate-binding domain-containing protein, partial [Bacteroidaceae bacterium]
MKLEQDTMKDMYFIDEEDSNNDTNTLSLIADIEPGGIEEINNKIPKIKAEDSVPILPLRNMILFPSVFMPVTVGRKSSLRLVKDAEKSRGLIAVVCQKSPQTEDPDFEDLETVGTLAQVIRSLKMPDNTTTIVLQGIRRIELLNIKESSPYLKGQIKILDDIIPDKNDKEFQVLMESCKELTIRYIKATEPTNQGSTFAINNISGQSSLT